MSDLEDEDELLLLRALRARVGALLRRARAGETVSLRKLAEAFYGPRKARAASDSIERLRGDCTLEDTVAGGRPGQAETLVRDSLERSSGTDEYARPGQVASEQDLGRLGQFEAFVRDKRSVERRAGRLLTTLEAAEFARSLANSVDPPVLWFTVRGYRCSFDLRSDSSRFIVLRQPGVLLAQGLLSSGSCLLDEDSDLPTGFQEDLIRIWTATQRWLRRRNRRRGHASDRTEEYPTD